MIDIVIFLTGNYRHSDCNMGMAEKRMSAGARGRVNRS
jgi:hypothetical protein